MIRTKKDLIQVIEADFANQHGFRSSYTLKQYFIIRILSIIGVEQYEIDRFKYLLRKAEYYKNNKKYIRYCYHKFLKERWARKLGFNIPENVCLRGLRLGHAGPIIINKSAKIGVFVTIHVGVNISERCFIGDNVYIGPGAKFISECNVPDASKVGANAVVTKKFQENAIILIGVPAQVKRG